MALARQIASLCVHERQIHDEPAFRFDLRDSGLHFERWRWALQEIALNIVDSGGPENGECARILDPGNDALDVEFAREGGKRDELLLLGWIVRQFVGEIRL